MNKEDASLFSVLLILNFLFLIFISSIASAIEVGGHLTEDTVWSPENNPYLVTGVIYVDDDVTLFIAPGTEIFINSALFNNDTYVQDFAFHGNEEPTAKMFWVDGRIIAQGTEQDSILFTRIQQDSTYFKWGIIYLSESAELSRFKHCRFEHASTIVINLTFQLSGALAVHNSVIVDKCYFIDNRYGIATNYPALDTKIEIIGNFFSINEGIDPNTTDWGRAIHLHSLDYLTNRIWIANNEFHNRFCSFGELISVVDNKFYGNGVGIKSDLLPNYIYDNYFYNVENPISASASEDEAGIYIRENIIEADSAFYCEGIKLNDYGYFEVSDNIVYGGIESSINSSGKVFNNIVHNTPISNSYNGLELGGYYMIFNNIVTKCYSGLTIGWRVLAVNNNVIINNRHALGNLSFSGIYHKNSIFIGNEELVYWPFDDTLYIQNCLIDSVVEGYEISGDNNFVINEDQINSIFIDYADNDFHLCENSMAIDAGFDTQDYYPFDLDYNHRIWDGDNNGTAVIDIGSYEYEAPQFGKIIGNITETDSGVPVNFVLLKIDNEPGIFTFADSLGNFEFQLPGGTYDIHAERIFYENHVVIGVTVEDEHTTVIGFNMNSTLPQVKVDDGNILTSLEKIKLSNYPNPFNPSGAGRSPETTITYQLPVDGKVEISIFNIKGQKVTTLISNQMQKGKHSVIWSGLDEHNKPVSSGIYLYKITLGNQESVKRMLLLK
ncbi:MAG: T9SS type A sorting domain-containing protein [Candidatus Cloacimonetes bacterium]|nr:T9SS type A sorting domain-containing protein [Candidatus Cloacimonadota bacterium]